ncbi:MAG: S-layer homology domain-containing protein, partial [bacterium]
MRLVTALSITVALTVVGVARAQPAPSDIAGYWAESSIVSLLSRNIIDLFPDQTFRPHEEIARGEFIKWIVLASGWPRTLARAPSFADVPAGHPLAPYIETAVTYR